MHNYDNLITKYFRYYESACSYASIALLKIPKGLSLFSGVIHDFLGLLILLFVISLIPCLFCPYVCL